MENLTPSRIQPLSSGQEKNTDDGQPLKFVKQKPSPKAVPPPQVETDEEEKHHLDERA